MDEHFGLWAAIAALGLAATAMSLSAVYMMWRIGAAVMRLEKTLMNLADRNQEYLMTILARLNPVARPDISSAPPLGETVKAEDFRPVSGESKERRRP